MKQQFSDESFDAVLKNLFSDAAMPDEKVDEIAGSPTIWWSVQRQIAGQKPQPQAAWPPIAKVWQILKFGVPAIAAAALLIGIFVFRPAAPPVENAGVAANTVQQVNETPAAPVAESNNGQTEVSATAAPVPSNAKKTPRAVGFKTGTSSRPSVKQAVVKDQSTVAKTEIRSEFIALSYARDAESGQIVRVKVPSSMMVTLGLASAVEKPTALVDAEVIVGDDGLTRAIRFIR